MELSCKVKVLVLALFAVNFFELSAADSLRTERIGDSYYVIHQVEKGETLYSLSKRYNSDLDQIVKRNGIVNYEISLGQELQIPIAGKPAGVTGSSANQYHTVAAGETLYSISRKYGVTVNELRAWNNLTSNEISVGQPLTLHAGSGVPGDELKKEADKEKGLVENISVAEDSGETKAVTEADSADENEVPEGFNVYHVQNGEMLGSIARKFSVQPDSIVIWNDLPNTYLSIGQKLLIRGEMDPELQKKAPNLITRPYGTIRKTTDQSGFIKIFEEGVASKIDSSVETEKYLALHRTLPMGTLIEVRNLMNNQKVFVRVVGKLPETGLNENVLVRLTPVCFERLGVIDAKARVEVSYYEE